MTKSKVFLEGWQEKTVMAKIMKIIRARYLLRFLSMDLYELYILFYLGNLCQLIYNSNELGVRSKEHQKSVGPAVPSGPLINWETISSSKGAFPKP